MVLSLLYSQRGTGCPRAPDTRLPNRNQNKTESNGERQNGLSYPIPRTRLGIGNDFPYAIALPSGGLAGGKARSTNPSAVASYERMAERNADSSDRDLRRPFRATHRLQHDLNIAMLLQRHRSRQRATPL